MQAQMSGHAHSFMYLEAFLHQSLARDEHSNCTRFLSLVGSITFSVHKVIAKSCDLQYVSHIVSLRCRQPWLCFECLVRSFHKANRRHICSDNDLSWLLGRQGCLLFDNAAFGKCSSWYLSSPLQKWKSVCHRHSMDLADRKLWRALPLVLPVQKLAWESIATVTA